MLAGWVLCTALREGGVEAQVKWPNDILVAGRKMGGILLEKREDILLAGVGRAEIGRASCRERV